MTRDIPNEIITGLREFTDLLEQGHTIKELKDALAASITEQNKLDDITTIIQKYDRDCQLAEYTDTAEAWEILTQILDLAEYKDQTKPWDGGGTTKTTPTTSLADLLNAVNADAGLEEGHLYLTDDDGDDINDIGQYHILRNPNDSPDLHLNNDGTITLQTCTEDLRAEFLGDLGRKVRFFIRATYNPKTNHWQDTP